MLRFLARLIAVLCAIAFVFVAVAVVIFHAAGTRFLHAQPYKDALVREQFYARFPGILADAAARVAKREQAGGAGHTGDPSAVLAALTPADWNCLLGALAPAAYLQQQVESGLDQVAVFLHSDAPKLAVNVSLAEFKRRLVGPEIEEAYVRMLQTKPPCTPQQLQGAGGLPLACRPPPERMAQVLQGFRKIMGSVAASTPDAVDLVALASAYNQTGREITALADMRGSLQGIERWAHWSPAVPAALLLLITLLAVRTLRGGLLWWGIPCFVAGAAAAVVALPVAPIARLVFEYFVIPNLPAGTPAVMVKTLLGLLTDVIQVMMNAALASAGILAAAGLVGMIAGRFCKRREVPAAPAPAG